MKSDPELTCLSLQASDPGEENHFGLEWRSMGFTPGSMLLEPVMEQTLQFNAAVAGRGIQYARPHYLLDLIQVKNAGTVAQDYDWTSLDRALDALHGANLKLVFELMGNPSSWWSDFADPTQLHAWKKLITDLALHCSGRYGPDTVRAWYWETWNEPDLPWWKWGEEAFLYYYDACSEGLREADAELRFGGPGTCETLHPYFTRLIAHCDRGTNYFTGEKGVRLDYISFHEKGGKWSQESIQPQSDRILLATHRILDWIEENHPDFLSKPFFNDEADPLIGWKQIHSWRAWPYYASFTAGLIDRHIREIRDERGIDFRFLSSDNGFIGKWGQRSQLACFGEEKERADGKFELIKKPVLALMGLLGRLGSIRIPLTLEGPPEVGCLASREDDNITCLIYCHHDALHHSSEFPVQINFGEILGKGPYRMIVRSLDEQNNHPFQQWEKADYPDDPDRDPAKAVFPDKPDPSLYERLRAVQEPCLLEEGDLQTTSFSTTMAPHSVMLIELRQKPAEPPKPPEKAAFRKYPGRRPGESIVLTWEGPEVIALRHYEVAYRSSSAEDWEIISPPGLIDRIWLHYQNRRPSPGEYRIRAIDLWSRPSEWTTLKLPETMA